MSKYKGFSKKELLDIYSRMYLSRALDEKQLILLKQGKGYFHIVVQIFPTCVKLIP